MIGEGMIDVQEITGEEEAMVPGIPEEAVAVMKVIVIMAVTVTGAMIVESHGELVSVINLHQQLTSHLLTQQTQTQQQQPRQAARRKMYSH